MALTRGDLWLVCWVHWHSAGGTWMWAAGTCRVHRDAEAAGDVGARILGAGQRRRHGDRPRISTVLAGSQRIINFALRGACANKISGPGRARARARLQGP
jgi:hypothetical protein